MSSGVNWSQGSAYVGGGGPFSGGNTIISEAGGNTGIYNSYSRSISGDVTIEFWTYYTNSRIDWCGIFGDWTLANQTAGTVAFMIGATYTICSAGGIEIYQPSTPGSRWADGLSEGWHHVAIVRAAGIWTVWIDGISRLVGTVVDTVPFNSSGYLIQNDSRYYQGLMWTSNFRISSMARYTSAFTPPTSTFNLATDSYASSVTAQLNFLQTSDNFDVTLRSTWAKSGTVVTDTNQAKFGAQSLLFDGSTGFVSTIASPDFDVKGLSWTVDLWVNPKSSMTGGFFSYPDRGTAGNTLPIAIGMSATGVLDQSVAPPVGYVLGCGYFNGSAWTTITDGTTQLVPLTWNHVEVGFDETSGTAYLFLNGNLLASGAWATPDVDFLNASPIALGRGWTSQPRYFQGWMQEFCFTAGAIRHTTAFTPPTAPYNLTTDPFASNIVCLVHGTQLPLGVPVTFADQIGLYSGYTTQLIGSRLRQFATAKVFQGAAGVAQVDVPLSLVDRGNSRYQIDTARIRTNLAVQIDPTSHNGFIEGICVVQGNPLENVTMELARNIDYNVIGRYNTDVDGLFSFHDLQTDVQPGFYLVGANPDPSILNENAQVYKALDATPYALTMSGIFNYEVGSLDVDSTVTIAGNAGPFTAVVSSGNLPPGAAITVSERSITITGATTLTGDYIFTLSVTGSVRNYSTMLQFELTPNTVKPMGQNHGYDGSTFVAEKQSSLLISMDMNGFSTPTTFKSSVAGLTDFTAYGSPGPTLSTAEIKIGDASLYLNGSSLLYSNQSITYPTAAFTIEAWAYPLTWPSSYGTIIGGNSHNGFQMTLAPSGTIYFYNGTASYAAGTVALNTWTHIATTWDGTTLTIWLNGVANYTTPFAGPANTNGLTDQINIGRDTSGAWFNGYLNRVKVWNVSIYTSTFTPPVNTYTPNLIIL
jgi:hypothetical protein